MHILTPGHKYGLVAFEGKADPQIIQFIEKKPVTGPDGTVTFTTINDGTTNEEVLQMMLNRLEFLQAKHPCKENEDAIILLALALSRLNDRTRDRQARQVEGTNKP
jgi:hypothetical protein